MGVGDMRRVVNTARLSSYRGTDEERDDKFHLADGSAITVADRSSSKAAGDSCALTLTLARPASTGHLASAQWRNHLVPLTPEEIRPGVRA